MFISFGRRLRGLGRVHFGFRIKGSAAWITVILYGLLYLCWYVMLGTLWLMYGICYLFFYLPVKCIIKLCKKKKLEKEFETARRKYTATYSSTTDADSSLD